MNKNFKVLKLQNFMTEKSIVYFADTSLPDMHNHFLNKLEIILERSGFLDEINEGQRILVKSQEGIF